MTTLIRLARLAVTSLILVGVLASCISGGDETPTQTPVIVTSTQDATAASASDPTSTPEAPSTPTATGTATVAPSATATASTAAPPTPTQSPVPTSTRPSIVLPTPTPASDGTSGLDIPDDLLTLLPVIADVPAGMVIVDEGPASINLVAADYNDAELQVQRLMDWGFQRAAMREFELPEDLMLNPDADPVGFISRVALLGSPEAAQAEMNSFINEVVLADSALGSQEITGEQLGDLSRMTQGTVPFDDNRMLQIVVVGVTAGPLSFQFIAGAGVEFDAVGLATTAAQDALDRVGYSAGISIGDVIFQTDFSNWQQPELEMGRIYFGEDGLYHLVVDQIDGSFVNTHTGESNVFENFAASVSMVMVAGAPSSLGCLIARTEPATQQYYYSLCVDGTGTVEALFEEFSSDGSYSADALIEFGTVTVDPPSGATQLAIVTRGNDLWFVVNGEVVGSGNHAGPTSGSVGVMVVNYGSENDPPAEFAFTNLVVQAVE